MATLDTTASIREMTNSFLCKPVGRAMTNPLTLAFMLTVIIMMVVVHSYDKKHTFRTAFRIFSVSTLFLFINIHILMDDISCKRMSADQNNILDIVEKGSDTSTGISLVVPVARVETVDDDITNPNVEQ
jgi:hypothetical protein